MNNAMPGRSMRLAGREVKGAAQLREIEMDVQEGVITGNYACAYSYAYRSIVGTGTVHRIQSPEMKRYGLERIMAHLAPDALPGFTDQALARTKIYCIDIEKFTGKQRA